MTTIRKINVSEVDGRSLNDINKSEHPQGQMALYEEYDNNFNRDVWKLRLPEGGIIAESIVTENPTIELVPADAESESQKLVIKGGAGDDYHLHLTNGDLTETSLFLGTDEHNVRTNIDGAIQITAYDYSIQEQKNWYFDPQGNLTFPDSSTQTTAYAPVSSSWTVAEGTATYSFTVPENGTYSMWVRGNIPDGIVVWNATVTVTNSNVPAIGQQFAWNYTDSSSPILLTAIPDQIKGAAGTISTDNSYAGTTSNQFDFTIANTSGEAQTVYYGYTKI